MKPNNRARLRLTALLLTAVALSACTPANSIPGTTTTHTDPARPFDGTRPADVVLEDFIKIIDDTIKHSGTTFPGWDPSRTTGYSTESCSINGSSDGLSYKVSGTGGAIKDPKTAANTMKTHWETLGYTDLGTVNWPGGSVEVSATTPNGARIVFAPTQTGSFINVKSECTLDPSLNQ